LLALRARTENLVMSTTLSDDNTLRFRVGIALLACVGVGAVAALLFVSPFPQDPAYHDFADQRTLLNVPHALNVLSNLPFVIFGAWGVVWLLGPAGRCSGEKWQWWAFLIVFTCVALTGFGSAYYHANPNNATLYWDRLPLTVVFMAFFCLVFADRVAPAAGAWLLVPFIAFGVFGVTWWHWTETQGAGDVRVYALVQFVPLAALPIILLAFPSRHMSTGDVWGVLAWYALAKVLELLDAVIWNANGVVSGHTLKHLTASLGALWLLLIVRRQRDVSQ
jgi:hypothetical protein